MLVAIGGPIESTRRPIGLTTRADWRPAPAQRALPRPAPRAQRARPDFRESNRARRIRICWRRSAALARLLMAGLDHLALIGFGEAGMAFAARLGRAGPRL